MRAMILLLLSLVLPTLHGLAHAQSTSQFGGQAAAQPTVQLSGQSMGQPSAQSPAQAGSQATMTTANAVRLQRYDVIDQTGFEKPLTAMTLLAPPGWQTMGGVVWQQNLTGCGPTAPHINWSVVAPDGIGVVSILPQESWSGFNYPSLGAMPPQGVCPNLSPMAGRDFILNYVSRYRPEARVLDYRDLTPEMAEVQRMMQTSMPSMQGVQSQVRVEAGMALVAYSVNGQEVRELIGTGVSSSVMRMSDYTGGYSETYFTWVFPGFAFRSANGQLDFNLAEVIRRSIKENPDWSGRMSQYHARIAKINSDGARQRAQTNQRSRESIARTNQDILDMQHDSWKKQQASGDYIQRESIEAIRGVETYDDPYNGGTIQLDSTYNNAWQLNDGTYVLTDDTSFQPFQTFGIDGVQLQQAQ